MANLIRYHEPDLLATWTPLDKLASLRDEMNRLVDWSFRGFNTPEEGLFSGWSPSLDIYQDKDNIYVKYELPGMKREDIDITLHEGMLTISGERKRESEFKEGETFRSERFFGKFHRSITLPTQVADGKVKASYQDGILSVILPKAEEVKAKHINVEVTG